MLAQIREEERLASWHLVQSDRQFSSGGAAGIDLLHTLGYPRASAAAALIAGPVELLYTLVAAHRESLGRLVPDGPAPRRFP